MCLALGLIIGLVVGVGSGVYFKDSILGGAKTAIHKAEEPRGPSEELK